MHGNEDRRVRGFLRGTDVISVEQASMSEMPLVVEINESIRGYRDWKPLLILTKLHQETSRRGLHTSGYSSRVHEISNLGESMSATASVTRLRSSGLTVYDDVEACYSGLR